MASLSSASLSCKRCLFPWGYASKYELTWQLMPGELARICHSLVHEVLLPLGLLEEELTNLKGRDALTLSNPDWFPIPAAADELFAVFTSLKPHNEVPQSCNFILNSAFLDFPGSSGIRYKVTPQLHACLPEWISPALFPQLAGWLLPLETQALRFGLNSFRSRFMTSFFGYVPTVADSFLIEANSSTLTLRIESDGLKRKGEAPAHSARILQHLDDALRRGLCFELLEDFADRVKLQQ
ncbi:MAG: hypothetical protein K1X79_07555 [Oligoflexia bacterium]|nr:hypothetical protein [Oligoflexia bacterium]